MGIIGGIAMVLFWTAVILLVVWAVRSFSGPTGPGGDEEALDTLKRRFAAGEISQAEFEQAKRALGVHS